MTIDPVIAAKLEGYDKAIERVQAIADKQPTPDQLNERLEALKELVEMRFEQLELRTNAVAFSDKKALDAAFQAAKEQFVSLELRINDIKDRVVELVARGVGSKQTYAAIFAAAAFVASMIGVIAFFQKGAS
jgi:hypothetical protein